MIRVVVLLELFRAPHEVSFARVSRGKLTRVILTPKAFANFSPGLLQPWDSVQNDRRNAESVGEALTQGCLPTLSA
jgi:hypothetical protein